uniref:Uncharacterized protein n=1 Tax=Anguilla anguilla TaxID=7936 RepID=A0A0E9XGQ5_ANGAN
MVKSTNTKKKIVTHGEFVSSMVLKERLIDACLARQVLFSSESLRNLLKGTSLITICQLGVYTA